MVVVILPGCPSVDVTPSASADVPALPELTPARGVPVSGRDGRTGPTMTEMVPAPAFRPRTRPEHARYRQEQVLREWLAR